MPSGAIAFGGCLRPDVQLVRPSETARPGWLWAPPPITIEGVVHNGNEPHLVYGVPSTQYHLQVHLPGTRNTPIQASCLLQAAASNRAPTIGLSYQWINRTDASRNAACAQKYGPSNGVGVAQCLSASHRQAIFGGNFEPTLWERTNPADSISGRLSRLLLHLAHTRPFQGWAHYLEQDGSPCWNRIVLSGHSQGGGHAAYLALQKHLAGAVLISAPQDEAVGLPKQPLYLDLPFRTKSVAVFGHGLEPARRLQSINHARMAVAGTLVTGRAQNYTDDIKSPPCKPVPLLSFAPTSDNSGCEPASNPTIRYHCSVGTDVRTPAAAGYHVPTALYSLRPWPLLYRASNAWQNC